MTKQEFLKLSGKEQISVMIGLTTKKKNTKGNTEEIEDKISIVKSWFQEILKTRYDIIPTAMGLLNRDKAREMGYDLETDSFESQELIRDEHRIGRSFAPKAKRYFARKYVEDARMRGYIQDESPGYVPSQLEKDVQEILV